jgi:hypothetical protein
VVSVTEKGAIALRLTPRTPQGDRSGVAVTEKEAIALSLQKVIALELSATLLKLIRNFP